MCQAKQAAYGLNPYQTTPPMEKVDIIQKLKRSQPYPAKQFGTKKPGWLKSATCCLLIMKAEHFLLFEGKLKPYFTRLPPPTAGRRPAVHLL